MGTSETSKDILYLEVERVRHRRKDKRYDEISDEITLRVYSDPERKNLIRVENCNEIFLGYATQEEYKYIMLTAEDKPENGYVENLDLSTGE